MNLPARFVLFGAVLILMMFYIACTCDAAGTVKLEDAVVAELKEPKPTVSGCELLQLQCVEQQRDGCAAWQIAVKAPGTCNVTFEFRSGPVTRHLTFRQAEGCDCGAPEQVEMISSNQLVKDAGGDGDD